MNNARKRFKRIPKYIFNKLRRRRKAPSLEDILIRNENRIFITELNELFRDRIYYLEPAGSNPDGPVLPEEDTYVVRLTNPDKYNDEPDRNTPDILFEPLRGLQDINFLMEVYGNYYQFVYLNQQNRNLWEDQEDNKDAFVLGEGEFGRVALGCVKHTSGEEQPSNKVTAVKMLKSTPAPASGGEANIEQEALINEINIFEGFTGENANVVKYLQPDSSAGTPTTANILTLEYFGCGLESWLSHGTNPDNIGIGIPYYLSYEMVIQFLRKIYSGIEFIHGQNIVHFDLAARNILISQIHELDEFDYTDQFLSEVHTSYILKITDFGIAEKVADTPKMDVILNIAQDYHYGGYIQNLMNMEPQKINSGKI